MNDPGRADNDYFVAWDGQGPSAPLAPWRGKHAVITPRFFEEVRAAQAKAMPDRWYYRPLKAEVEITNRCDQNCRHCGMGAGNAADLPDDLLFSLPDALAALAIPGISLTGGEPFLALPRMLALLARCRGRVDVVKLSTNASWAVGMAETRRILGQLCAHGLAAGRLFRPVLLVSIGEQTVPLDHVVRVFLVARELFDERELALCVSSLSLRFGTDRLAELEGCYEALAGVPFPWDKIFLTRRTYLRAGRALLDGSLPQRRIPLSAFCKPRGCFRQTIGAVVVPTPLIRSNGDVYSCSVFGMPSSLRLGNLHEAALPELLAAANANPLLETLTRGSLPLLAAGLPAVALDNTVADNFHEACWRLIELRSRLGPSRPP